VSSDGGLTPFQAYLQHLDSIIDAYYAAVDPDSGTVSEQDAIGIIARARNLLVNMMDKNSPYAQQVDDIWSEYSYICYQAEMIIGVLKGLRDELIIGALDSVPELIRGELFEDFLEMAEYLHSEGYKDAAAVIASSSLDVQLRRLATKHEIEIEMDKVSGVKPRYKKDELLNQELYKAKVYSPYDQKQITAWLDLRNNAAHGNFSNYSEKQVAQCSR